MCHGVKLHDLNDCELFQCLLITVGRGFYPEERYDFARFEDSNGASTYVELNKLTIDKVLGKFFSPWSCSVYIGAARKFKYLKRKTIFL